MRRVIRKVFRNKVFDRKVVLITGGCAGIGRALAMRFAQGGARLVLLDLDQAALDSLAQHLRDHLNAETLALRCDVADAAAVQAAVALAVEQFGGIDVLINNAGLGTSKRLVEMADDEWHKVIDVTLTGTFRMTRAAMQVMQPRGRGVIVNNASVLGWRAQVEQAHYAAAKAGVMALTRYAALEAAEFGLRINAVAPSIAIHAFLKKSASEELLNQLSEKEAFGRGAEPWEVANVMIFLASDYSSYMTSEVVSVSSQRA